MNIYLWEGLTGLTDSHHDGGGAAVIAETWEGAVKLLREGRPHLQDDEDLALRWSCFPLAEPAPAHKVFIFPNAGCC